MQKIESEMKILSWHPVLTDHQSYTLDALKKKCDGDLEVYVAKTSNVERNAQGWVNKHASSLSSKLIPNKGWLKFIIKRLRNNSDAVHIFGSPFEQPKLIIVLLIAIVMGRRVYLISEPYSPISIGYQNDKRHFINWLKSQVRPFLYRIYGVLLRRRIEGVFAISCLAIEQYKRIGFASKKIFPFGYFVTAQNAPNISNTPDDSLGEEDFKLVFVGNLIARKGLDVLINSIRTLNEMGFDLTLDVYGPGDPNQYSFDESKIRYCGKIPFGNSQSVISKYDFLILPSRFDGWGVVVNEALMAGVPVICSNQVGASAIISKWLCGTTFVSGDASDLAFKLEGLLQNKERFKSMRTAAKMASYSLEPKVAGQYMFDIINQNSIADSLRKKIESPWYECE